MDSWDYPHSYAHHDDACLRLGGRGRVSPTQCLIGKNIHELARGSRAVFSQPEATDVEMSGANLTALLRRVSEASMREIESLIGDLQSLRKKLHTNGNRIQRDITEYAELNQQVMQLT